MQRNEGESIKEYKIRICENKDLISPRLTWEDVAKIINTETGDNFSESSYRKWWTSFRDGRDYQKRLGLTSDNIIKEYELKRIEFEKERQRFFDQRNSYSRMIRPEARRDELFDIIQKTIAETKNSAFENNDYVEIDSDNDLLIQLNDLHVGADIKNAWNTYNSDVCRLYLQQYLDKIKRVQNIHNSENCFVSLGGDLISGSIHYPIAVENKENIIEQIKVVSQMASEFVYSLSSMFKTVTVAVVAGNHSRLGKKDESLYQERLDNIIPWYMQAKLQNITNVRFIENIDASMFVMNIRGKKYVGVHGDFETSKHALQSLNIMNNSEVYAICTGHRHHNLTDILNDIKILMSGSMLGMDSYCIEHRIVGKPQQLLSVCTNEGIIASYDIMFE